MVRFFVLILAFTFTLTAQDRWYPDLREALKVAREQNKPIMLYFYEETCSYCKYMEDVVFVDPAVSKFMRDNLIVVPIDVEDPPSYLDRRLRVFGTPHFTFYDPFKRKVIFEIIGMQEADDFLTFLKKACRKFERRTC